MLVEVLLFLLLLLVYLIIKDRKPANMPPGDFEIPFLGNMPIFEADALEKTRKRHGDVITSRTGKYRSVLIFDYKTGKETMASADFADRPAFFSEFSIDDRKKGGVVSSNGVYWVHNRRFVMRNLRNLGMGKTYLEDAINVEAQALVDDLKLYQGEPVIFPYSLKTAALNVIWQMVASKRFDLRSEDVREIYDATNSLKDLPARAMLPTFMPVLKRVFPKSVRNVLFGEGQIDSFFDKMKHMVDKHVIEHEKTFDRENLKDLIDEYLKEMQEHEGEEDSLVWRGSLLQIVSDLFGAGSDTIYNMMTWVVFLMARYPDIVNKAQKEIHDIVPRNNLVSITDKPSLPYVEAFMTESLRYSSMIILNVQRSAVRDTTVAGYYVPKDTVVTVSSYNVHYDTEFWDEPDQFKPERFINEEGKFQSPKEGFFAFGAGRRQCAGESLARMEFFLFTAALIQNFNIIVPEGNEIDEDFNGTRGQRVPKSQKFIYKFRQ